MAARQAPRRWLAGRARGRLEGLYARGRVRQARWEARVWGREPGQASSVLRLMMRQKDWAGARDLADHWEQQDPERLSRVKPVDVRRLRRFAERRTALATHLRGHPLTVRVPGVDGTELGSALSSRPVTGGKIAIACFRHDLGDAGVRQGLPARVFEKVYDASTREKADREALLFAHVSPEAVMSPRFLGTYATDEFVSVFYEYVDPVPVPDDEWPRIRLEIARRLAEVPVPWRGQLPKGVPCRRTLKPLRQLARDPDRLGRLLDEADGATPEPRSVADLLSEVVAHLRRQPLAITHGDLSHENVLRTVDGGYVLVDWDKWSLEPLGAGLRLDTPDQLTRRGIAATLEAMTQTCANCDFRAVQIATLAAGFSDPLRAGEFPMAQRWLTALLAASTPWVESSMG